MQSVEPLGGSIDGGLELGLVGRVKLELNLSARFSSSMELRCVTGDDSRPFLAVMQAAAASSSSENRKDERRTDTVHRLAMHL